MIAILNHIISSLAYALSGLLDLLPTSPFNFVLNIDSTWLSAINWIFPVASVVAHLEVYVLAVAMYFAIRIALRWIKAAQN